MFLLPSLSLSFQTPLLAPCSSEPSPQPASPLAYPPFPETCSWRQEEQEGAAGMQGERG